MTKHQLHRRSFSNTTYLYYTISNITSKPSPQQRHIHTNHDKPSNINIKTTRSHGHILSDHTVTFFSQPQIPCTTCHHSVFASSSIPSNSKTTNQPVKPTGCNLDIIIAAVSATTSLSTRPNNSTWISTTTEAVEEEGTPASEAQRQKGKQASEIRQAAKCQDEQTRVAVGDKDAKGGA